MTAPRLVLAAALVAALASTAVAQEETPPGTPTPEASPTPPIMADPLDDAAPVPEATPDSTAAPEATATPDAAATPEPWATATPSATPDAIATPAPVATPAPGATPAPAATPEPVATPEPAPAAEEPHARWVESPKWYSAELGMGGLQLEGDVASAVYGDDYEPAIHGRLGFLLFSILDLGVSADFAQIEARRLGADSGTESAEITRLTLVPITASAIVRLDFFPNQPIVPYAGAGYSYLVWSERNPIEDDQTDGDKQGVSMLGGVQILLDWMEPARATDLDSWWGVNDTFLILEASRATYGDSDDQEGLDLGHVEGRAAFLFEF